MRTRMTIITPGLRAVVHAFLIWAIAFFARPIRFRGVQRLTWEISRFFSPDHRVTVRISEDTQIIVPLGDGYWTKLLNRHYVYEPEIAAFISHHVDKNAYFLDCGANIGYWSMLCRKTALGVVALEANPTTFRRLEENARLNEADITLVNAALWNSDGDELVIVEQPRHHAGAAVARDLPTGGAAGQTSSSVRSVTLRSLIDRHCPDPSAAIVVKLDVEGAEIPALQGAGDLLRERNIVVAYEDHGSDPSCQVSRYVLDQGMVTADAATGEPLSLDTIAARKTKKWKGYNFLAYFPR